MAQRRKTNRVGNKLNSYLNGEWAGHVRKWGKKMGSKARRALGKLLILNNYKHE